MWVFGSQIKILRGIFGEEWAETGGLKILTQRAFKYESDTPGLSIPFLPTIEIIERHTRKGKYCLQKKKKKKGEHQLVKVNEYRVSTRQTNQLVKVNLK